MKSRTSKLNLTPQVERELKKAFKKYKDFHWGKNADKTFTLKKPIPPDTVISLGRLRSLTYETQKEGDPHSMHYIHAFEPPFPLLCSDPVGKHLFIFGGNFTIEKEGIKG